MKRLSLRARLAFMFSGLVLTAGLLLLGVTYLLVDSRLPHTISGKVSFSPGPGVGDPNGPDMSGAPPVSLQQVTVRSSTGETVTADRLPGVLKDSALQTLLTQGGIALGVITVLAGAFAWL